MFCNESKGGIFFDFDFRCASSTKAEIEIYSKSQDIHCLMYQNFWVLNFDVFYIDVSTTFLSNFYF